METPHITINEQPYPFYAGLAAIGEFCRIEGIGIGRYTLLIAQPHELDIQQVATMGWAAVKHGHRRENKEFSLSLFEFMDLIEPDDTVLTQILTEYGLASTVEEPDSEKKPQEVAK